MPLALSDKLPAVLRGRLGVVLVALVGGCLAIGISSYLHLAESRIVRQEIDRRISLRHDLLGQSLHEYDSSLHALRLLVRNSASLTPAEFERAAIETRERAPGIQAVQWVALVPAADLPAFVARARALVDSGYTPRQRLPDGSVEELPVTGLPASGRDGHALISYVHPRDGNEASFGYDTYTAQTAPDLARAATQPGRSILSRGFLLVQGGEGVVLTSYIDRPSNPANPPPLGGPGYVQLVLRLDTVLAKAWNFTANPILDVMLVDVTDEPVHLFTQIGDAREPASLAAPPRDFVTADTSVRDLPLGGRLWRAYYRPRTDWIASRRSHASLFSLIGGGLLTLVSAAYLNTLRRQTERVRREVTQRTAELAESRALLNEIIDHNPSAIWVKDAAFRYQLVNISFAAHYGRPRSEILGRTDEILQPGDVVRAMEALDARIFATGETVSFEETYQMADRRRTYLVSKFPLRRDDGTIYAVAGIATDITALREAEADRRAFERKLLETQKLESLGVLAGGVAHDFNNLLTGILGHANLARAQLPPEDPAQASLAQIEIASQRAAELCRQMLAYSGRGRLAVQPVDLGEVIRDTVNLLKLSLSRRARLRFDLAPALPLVVADLVQIRQIAMNLVLNASEALVDGDGEIRLSTRVVRADAGLFAECVFSPELPSGDYACLEVADTGCGMSPETLAKIFDPFFSTKFTGRGLGLAATLGIVRGHNGALQVTSRPGAGTTFRLYLPVAPATTAAPRPPEPAPPRPAGGLRILLVDDETAVRDTAGPLLGSCGHHVDCCADGESALARFLDAPESYDVAILDLTMPGLSGGALLRRLREIRAGLPVLLMSGYSEHDHATHELLAAPRVAFLAKPFTLAALRTRLAELVAR